MNAKSYNEYYTSANSTLSPIYLDKWESPSDVVHIPDGEPLPEGYVCFGTIESRKQKVWKEQDAIVGRSRLAIKIPVEDVNATPPKGGVRMPPYGGMAIVKE